MGIQLTKSQKTLDDINRVKSVIDSINDSMKLTSNVSEISRWNELLNIMLEQLKALEGKYEIYLKSDGPYYEPSSFEYFQDEFQHLDFTQLESAFVSEVNYYIESEYTKNKLKVIENIAKAYNLRNSQLLEAYKRELASYVE